MLQEEQIHLCLFAIPSCLKNKMVSNKYLSKDVRKSLNFFPLNSYREHRQRSGPVSPGLLAFASRAVPSRLPFPLA